MNAFFYPSKRGINFAKIRGFKVTDYNSRGTHVQVAARALMGSNSRSTDEVLLTGAPGRRAIGKQLPARKHTAGKGSTCGQGKTLPAEVPIRYSTAKRADEMEFIVRSQREP